MIDIVGAVSVESIDEASRDQPEPAHAAAGVRPVAAHYGDPLREQRTLETAVGLVDRSHRGVIAVPGEDRLGWLHTLTTQHLAELPAGQGTELLVLSPHGHVEQHAMVAEDGGTTWLDTEPGDTGGLLGYLERMRFFSKVEPRDVTPEATVAVCDRILPGFGEQMRAVSMQTVPTAILSRQIAGSRGASLIINLPGKPVAIEECLRAVWAAVPYCVELLGGPRLAFTDAAPRHHRPTSA